MKLLYTKKEIEKLSEKDISNMLYFGGDDFQIAYKDIKRINTGETGSVDMTDGSTYKADEDLLSQIKSNKLRYDLLIITIQSSAASSKATMAFQESIQQQVSEQVALLQESYKANTVEMTNALNTIQIRTTALIEGLGTQIDEVSASYNTKLEAFDIEVYKTNIIKIEKITDAFKELLA